MRPNGCRLGSGVDKSDISMRDSSSLEIGITSEDVLMHAERVREQAGTSGGHYNAHQSGSGVGQSGISMPVRDWDSERGRAESKGWALQCTL